MNGYECDGQINMFDDPIEEEPIMLDVGQKIFTVKCGDVREEIILNTYSLKKDRGYHTNNGVVWNSSIGVDVFLEKEDAENVSELFLKSHEVIYPEDIRPIETRAWHYIRDIDRRDMIAFYAIMEDGKVYKKDFYTFHHIKDYGSIEKARKSLGNNFCKDDFLYERPTPIPSYVPEFKIMYRCISGVDWGWEESGYSGVIK